MAKVDRMNHFRMVNIRKKSAIPSKTTVGGSTGPRSKELLSSDTFEDRHAKPEVTTERLLQQLSDAIHQNESQSDFRDIGQWQNVHYAQLEQGLRSGELEVGSALNAYKQAFRIGYDLKKAQSEVSKPFDPHAVVQQNSGGLQKFGKAAINTIYRTKAVDTSALLIPGALADIAFKGASEPQISFQDYQKLGAGLGRTVWNVFLAGQPDGGIKTMASLKQDVERWEKNGKTENLQSVIERRLQQNPSYEEARKLVNHMTGGLIDAFDTFQQTKQLDSEAMGRLGYAVFHTLANNSASEKNISAKSATYSSLDLRIQSTTNSGRGKKTNTAGGALSKVRTGATHVGRWSQKKAGPLLSQAFSTGQRWERNLAESTRPALFGALAATTVAGHSAVALDLPVSTPSVDAPIVQTGAERGFAEARNIRQQTPQDIFAGQMHRAPSIKPNVSPSETVMETLSGAEKGFAEADRIRADGATGALQIMEAATGSTARADWATMIAGGLWQGRSVIDPTTSRGSDANISAAVMEQLGSEGTDTERARAVEKLSGAEKGFAEADQIRLTAAAEAYAMIADAVGPEAAGAHWQNILQTELSHSSKAVKTRTPQGLDRILDELGRSKGTLEERARAIEKISGAEKGFAEAQRTRLIGAAEAFAEMAKAGGVDSAEQRLTEHNQNARQALSGTQIDVSTSEDNVDAEARAIEKLSSAGKGGAEADIIHLKAAARTYRELVETVGVDAANAKWSSIVGFENVSANRADESAGKSAEQRAQSVEDISGLEKYLAEVDADMWEDYVEVMRTGGEGAADAYWRQLVADASQNPQMAHFSTDAIAGYSA